MLDAELAAYLTNGARASDGNTSAVRGADRLPDMASAGTGPARYGKRRGRT